MKAHQVKELHGLYGSFTLSERILQQIWLRQDFAASSLKTTSGRRLEILNPGQWNHGGGPDFKQASLRIDGELRRGDVEVHFNASDWEHHGHDRNPAFQGVILHVVLFQPKPIKNGLQKRDSDFLETFCLLPKLEIDLESYAESIALREMEAVNHLEWVNAFMGLNASSRRATLEHAGRRRWKQKVTFAKTRLESLDWNTACHQYLLEVLGYARNRVPMTRIADRFPLSVWQTGTVEVSTVYASESENWARSGMRPSNHPKQRLNNYQRLVHAISDWPVGLRSAIQALPEVTEELPTSEFRRRAGMTSFQKVCYEQQLLSVAGRSR